MSFYKRAAYLILKACVALTLTTQPSLSTAAQEKAAAARESVQPASVGADEALARARQLALDARALEPVAQRIRFLARLGDTLWEWDEALAEQLIWQSFDLIVAAGKQPREEAGREAFEPYLLYRQIAGMVARRNAALAHKLAEKWKLVTESEAEAAPLKSMPPEQLSNFMLAEAARTLRQDEEKARASFRQSVATRVLPAHTHFLLHLRAQSPELADRLFADALGALAQRPLTEANEILAFASYLFTTDGGVGYQIVGGYNAANVSSNLSAPPKNAALARQYLALVLNKLAPGEAAPAAVVYFALKNLLPQFRASAPDLADDAAARMAALAPDVSRADILNQESSARAYAASAVDAARTWEERARKADKIDNPNLRDLEYFTLIDGHLLPRKEFAEAERLAGRVTNDVLREKLSDYVLLASLRDAARQKDAAALQYAPAVRKMKDPLLKTLALAEAARVYAARKDAVEVEQILTQASAEAARVGDEQDRLQSLLLVAQLRLAADAPKGFEAAAAAFREINKASGFDMWRAGFSLRLSVYGMSNELPLDAPAPASLIATVERMCRVNCSETFVVGRLLADKSQNLWATLRAVDMALAEAKKQRDARKADAP